MDMKGEHLQAMDEISSVSKGTMKSLEQNAHECKAVMLELRL